MTIIFRHVRSVWDHVFDGKYEITYGLTEGEEVVTQGGYLIDSESQLKTGTGATHQHGARQTEDASKDPPAQHNH